MRPTKLVNPTYVGYVLGYSKGEYIRHRNGGPAFISNYAMDCEWWVHNIHYERTRGYCAALKYTKIKTMAMILKYGETLPTKWHDG